MDEDANLKDVVERIIIGAFYQSGQSCIGVQRIVAHEAIYEALKEKLVSATQELISGDPKDESTFIGLMIDVREAQRLEAWIQARKQGGNCFVVGAGRERCLKPPCLKRCPRTN